MRMYVTFEWLMMLGLLFAVDHALDDNLERRFLLVIRSCCNVDCRPGGDAPDGSYEALVDSRHTSSEDNNCERADLRNWMFFSSAFIPPESTEGRVHELLFRTSVRPRLYCL